MVATGAHIPNSTVNTEYVAAGLVTDALGNAAVVQLATQVNPTFGVDKNAPINFALTGGPAHMSAFNAGDGEPGPYQFTALDDLSGFTGTPYRVVVNRYAPGLSASQRCVIGSYSSSAGCAPVAFDSDVDLPTEATGGAGYADGYYEVHVYVQDRATNTSETIMRITMRDHTNPVTGNVGIPATLTGGANATFTNNATDNLDLATAQAQLRYSGSTSGFGEYLWFGMPSVYGTYGFDAFTTSQTLSETIPFVRALWVVAAGGGYNGATNTAASHVRFDVFDVAGNQAQPENAFAGGTVGATDGVDVLGDATYDDPDTNDNVWSVSENSPAGNDVCNASGSCPSGTPSSVTLTASITGNTGIFDAPFAANRVYFYYTDGSGGQQLIGTATSRSSTDDNTTRTWIYSVTFTPATLPAGAANLYAVGVDANGDALISEAEAVTID